MLINCELSDPLYVLGSSIQSEEIAEFVRLDHSEVFVVHHNDFDELPPGSQCIIGFTNIDYRIRVINKLKNKLRWPSFIHSAAIVEPTSKIGAGCLMYPMATIMHNTMLNDFCSIYSHAHVSHGVVLGKNVAVCPGVIIGGSTTIGDNVFIGQSCSIKDKISICSNVKIAMTSSVTRSIDLPGSYVNNRKTGIVL